MNQVLGKLRRLITPIYPTVEIPPLPASHPTTARLVLSNGSDGVVFFLPYSSPSSSSSTSSFLSPPPMPQRSTDVRCWADHIGASE